MPPECIAELILTAAGNEMPTIEHTPAIFSQLPHSGMAPTPSPWKGGLWVGFLPYHESDHILNIAYNFLAGGSCLQDIELLRNDEGWLNALGAQDPTTAGDFLRRFTKPDICAFMDAKNTVRKKVWQMQPATFLREAVINVDGTICATDGECKQGMDISYNGQWGYHPLVISLHNTREPLFIVNRSGKLLK
jgi:hypothetical protein